MGGKTEKSFERAEVCRQGLNEVRPVQQGSDSQLG